MHQAEDCHSRALVASCGGENLGKAIQQSPFPRTNNKACLSCLFSIFRPADGNVLIWQEKRSRRLSDPLLAEASCSTCDWTSKAMFRNTQRYTENRSSKLSSNHASLESGPPSLDTVLLFPFQRLPLLPSWNSPILQMLMVWEIVE